ncbi:MAG: nucleoside-diphosphate kinase [Candidatus Peribacteria bacterium]|jgi:nucleoside-diphosphate kinase|nr:nucleoside-diphosphate kinase [Candidatus Peribacteria bacterium]
MEEQKAIIERTLIVLKSDAVQRGLTGEIMQRFEKRGLKIVGQKMMRPNKEFFYYHYETIGKMVSRHGEAVFDRNLQAMLKGPVIAVVLEGVEAVKVVRQMVGTTEPAAAQPGTIRGDYAHMSFDYGNGIGIWIPNLVHASGDQEEARAEIAHWFNPAELFEYSRCDQSFFY